MSATSEPTSHSRKRRRLLKWVLEALVLVLAVYLIHLWQTRNSVHGVVPPLEGPLLHGDSFSLHDRGQKPLLVYFWATWCPVCSATSDHVQKLSEEHAVVTVAMQSGSAAEVSRFLADKELDFPVVLDPEGEISRSWRVDGVPTLYFLDAENRIRHVSVGFTAHLPMWLMY
jgi:peroxiredoxin